MSPRHLAERRALYAAIDATGDNHVRPRVLDPRVIHSPVSTVGVCNDALWLRHHQSPAAPRWCVKSLHATAGASDRLAVIDDYGDLVEVAS